MRVGGEMTKQLLGFAKINLVFLLILSMFLQYIPIAKADTTSPASDTGTFYLRGNGASILFVGKVQGSTKTIAFNRDDRIKNLTVAVVDDAVGTDVSGYSSFIGYRLLAGTGSEALSYELNSKCANSPANAKNPNYLNDVGYFLLVGVKTSGTVKIYRPVGLMYHSADDFHSPYLTPNDPAAKLFIATETRAKSNSNNYFPYIAELAKFIIDRSNDGTIIQTTMESDTLESTCVKMRASWVSLQQKVQEFFDPMPSAEQPCKNENWTNKRDDFWEKWLSAESFRNHMLNLFETVGLPKDVLNNAKSDQFGLTKKGGENAISISEQVKELLDIIETVKASTDTSLAGYTPEWHCGNTVKATEFIWNEKLNGAPINSMDTLVAQVNKLNDSFVAFKEATNAPVGEGSECTASGSSGSTTLGMLNEVFCSLILVFQDWVTGIFNIAVSWLKTSLGVTNGKSQSIGGASGVSDITPTGIDRMPTTVSTVDSSMLQAYKNELNNSISSTRTFSAVIAARSDPSIRDNRATITMTKVKDNIFKIKINSAVEPSTEKNSFLITFKVDKTCYEISVIKNPDDIEKYEMTDSKSIKVAGDQTCGASESSAQTQ